ncbi:hypothetical protein H8Z58_29015 [Mycolicibacterium fortuitum]|nr:hypothetical protein [Mycolicibacterium fortuitum]
MTDDELEQLRDKATDAPDPAWQFLRALNAEQDCDWIAELADRLARPSHPQTRNGNDVPQEGRPVQPGAVTDRQRLADFARAITDPTHEPTF